MLTLSTMYQHFMLTYQQVINNSSLHNIFKLLILWITIKNNLNIRKKMFTKCGYLVNISVNKFFCFDIKKS